MSTSPQGMQALLRMAQQAGGMMGAPQGVTQGIGDVNSALGIYNGINSGTVQGDLGALASAGRLYGNLTNNPAITQDAGALGGALGVYGGLKQGGVYGDAQAAVSAAQLGSAVGAVAPAVGAWASGIGGFLGALYSASQPGVQLDPSYYKRMNETLSKGPDDDQYWGAVLEASASDDPIEKKLLNAYGIQPAVPVTQNLPYAELNQFLNNGSTRGMASRPHGRMAEGGAVKNHLDHILGMSPMHTQPVHYDDGGYVEYTPETLGYPIDQQYSPPTPDYSQFVLPTDQPGLQQALYNNDPTSQNSNPLGGGLQIPAYLQNPNIQGLGGSGSGHGLNLSGLSGLLSNPSLLGALLGGGIGLAGALGSNNGQSTMLANYKPTPPQMFQGSGPSASNMYGNFSAQPRQRLNPTNIDYAHAGEHPTPGGNLFYSPSGGGPTAAPSQQSPLQQYGAQMPQSAPPQAPQQQSPAQLLNMLTGNQGLPPILYERPNLNLHAEGGEIHGQGSPMQGPLSRHMVPATKGGPSYIQGPGDGTSDDIDARLSNGEYVMDAGSVAMLGNGSNEAGAKKLDELRMNLRKHAGQDLVKGKQFMKAKKPMSYLGGKS